MKEIQRKDDMIILRLDVGDNLPESVTSYCADKGIEGGQVTAIGAVRKSVIGFYDLKEKKYLEKEYSEHHELISLNGNISMKEGKPFLHAHIAIADKDNRCYAGHLVSCEISATGELFIRQTGKVERMPDDDGLGLHVLS